MSKHEQDTKPGPIEAKPSDGAVPAAEVVADSVVPVPKRAPEPAPAVDAPAPTDETPTLVDKPDPTAAEAKKKDKKKKKKKKEDPAAAIEASVTLSEEQKSAVRLRAESRLKKEYERSIDAKLRNDLDVDENELKSLKKKLIKAKGSPERGIETWFRLASRNLYTRRQIVDTKSNILITVNSIILSVVLGTMSREIADQPHLAIAIVPLVVANLFSMAFAIFATKPKVATGVFTEEDIESRQVSLMTFDDFYKMGHEDYQRAIERVLEDRNLLYGTIQRDIYSLGLDLSHRYLQIQRSYSVFLTGVVFATLLFGATSYYFA